MINPFASVAVLGAGAWGTALAQVAAAAPGGEVTLWAREPEVVEAINTRHENSLVFAGYSAQPKHSRDAGRWRMRPGPS